MRKLQGGKRIEEGHPPLHAAALVALTIEGVMYVWPTTSIAFLLVHILSTIPLMDILYFGANTSTMEFFRCIHHACKDIDFFSAAEKLLIGQERCSFLAKYWNAITHRVILATTQFSLILRIR